LASLVEMTLFVAPGSTSTCVSGMTETLGVLGELPDVRPRKMSPLGQSSIHEANRSGSVPVRACPTFGHDLEGFLMSEGSARVAAVLGNAIGAHEGSGTQDVLLRALAPLTGLELMRAARPKAHRDRDLCSGPARLTQALGITGVLDGSDLVTGAGGFRIVDDGTPPPAAPVVGTRIGISQAVDEPWRWYVPDDPNVSRR